MAFFYDPHPGLMGCTIPIPNWVKDIADELDGKDLEIDVAIKRLEEAASNFNGKIKRLEDCILLSVGDVGEDIPRHTWRVIRYKNST